MNYGGLINCQRKVKVYLKLFKKTSIKVSMQSTQMHLMKDYYGKQAEHTCGVFLSLLDNFMKVIFLTQKMSVILDLYGV